MILPGMFEHEKMVSYELISPNLFVQGVEFRFKGPQKIGGSDPISDTRF